MELFQLSVVMRINVKEIAVDIGPSDRHHAAPMRPGRFPFPAWSVIAILLGTVAQTYAGTEAWVRRYAADAGANDQAKKVALDSAGSVFVAGESATGITGTDIALIKYSSDGVPLWTNRYNGPGNGDDSFAGLALDNTGNAYLACSSYNASGHYDFVTLAFSGAGVPLWTNLFSDMAGGDNYAVGLATRAGKIFLTGFSRGGSTSDKYVTLAYSSAGTALWTNRYNGPQLDDYPKAIVADDNGNVFVTGNSSADPSVSFVDFLTIAYSSTGVPLWTNRFDGPGHELDSAVGITVDRQGNVYVTGQTWDTGNNTYSVQFATIAYSNSGVPLWTNISFPGHYDIPAAIVTDNTNVYVTGSSIDFYQDFATIAYSCAGIPLWTNRYHGPSADPEYPQSIGVDSAGNVYVTGQSADGFTDETYDYATIAYSSTGVPLWTNRYGGPANEEAFSLAVNSNGNVFVTGFSPGLNGSYDFTTLAYSNSGALLWITRYDGLGHSDNFPVALALGGDTNAYVTGYSAGSSGAYDFTTLAWTSAGAPLWTNRYHGSLNVDDYPQAIAVGPKGNVYVTGYSFGYNYYDYATIAYSSAGVPLWTNRYDGTAHSDDYPTAIAVDSHNGNVYVTGYSYGGEVEYGGTQFDYATVAYSSDGTPLWTNRYDDPIHADDTPRAIAVDNSGRVYVTGYATIAYSATGTPLWTNIYVNSSAGVGQAIATDGANNVYVSGSDFATSKYSSAGTLLWSRQYNAGMGLSSQGQAMTLDGKANVIVTGYSTHNTAFFQTVAYSTAGTLLWTKVYSGTNGGNSIAKAVRADARGNVFVTGYSPGMVSDDIATVAYLPSGAPLWTNRYNGPANGVEAVQGSGCLAVAANGDVYVAAASDGDFGSGRTYEYALIKYSFPNIQFTAISTLSPSNCRVTISAPTNINYRLEASTDLASWTALTNFFGLSSESIQFDDNFAVNFPHRFYRAVWLP